jgi:hypothetical protein
MRSHATLVLVLGALTLAPPADAAITVDGHLDPDYGAALATQTTQTSFVDANPAFSPNPTLYADGTELDVLYLTVEGAHPGRRRHRLLPPDDVLAPESSIHRYRCRRAAYAAPDNAAVGD